MLPLRRLLPHAILCAALALTASAQAADAATPPTLRYVTASAGATKFDPLTLSVSASAPRTSRTAAATARLELVGAGEATSSLGTVRIPGLKPGKRWTKSLLRRPDASLAAGDYQVRICIGSSKKPRCRGGSIVSLRTQSGSGSGTTGTTPAPAQLVASTSTVAFGSTTVATTAATQLVQITNTGGARSGELQRAVTGTHANDFTLLSSGQTTCGTTLAAGASCTLALEFRPSAVGARAAKLLVGATPGGELLITLGGTGLPIPPTPAKLSLASGSNVTTASADLGTITAFPLSNTTHAFTVYNRGEQSTGPLTITPTGGFSQTNDCPSGGLPGGSSCTVTASPQGVGTEDLSGSVQVTDSGSAGSSVTVNITALLRVPASLSLTLATTDFNTSYTTAQSSETRDVTLTNTGGATANGINVSVFTIQNVAGGYELASTTCGTSLAGGASCTITVRFTPALSGGSSPTTLAGRVRVTATGLPDTTLALSTRVDGVPQLALNNPSDASINFGSFTIAGSGASRTITLRNPGDGTLTGGLTLDVTQDSSGFSAANSTCGTLLTPIDTCQFTVRYDVPGTGEGLSTATITATWGGRSVQIQATATDNA